MSQYESLGAVKIEELAAAISPGRILAIVRPNVNSHRLVCVYALPLAHRLHCTIEEAFAQAQKKSFISSERSLGAVDLFEAKTFCQLILRRNPRILSALLVEPNASSWGTLLYEAEPWAMLRQRCSAAEFAGASLARSCAHQAHGKLKRLRASLLNAADLVSKVQSSSVRSEWSELAELLSITTSLLGSSADALSAQITASLNVGDDPPYPSAEETDAWLATCDRCVQAAEAASQAERKAARADRRMAVLSVWLEVASRRASDDCGGTLTGGAPAVIVGDGGDDLAPRPSPPQPSGALLEVLDRLAQPVDAGRVAFAVRCGSYMYNLATPQSDEDYQLIYTHAASELLALEAPRRHFERHICLPFGSDKSGEVECTGVEFGEFVLQLMKGNSKNVEASTLSRARPRLSSSSFSCGATMCRNHVPRPCTPHREPDCDVRACVCV